MSTLNKTIISGAHLGFARDGVTYSGQPVSASNMPVADDSTYEDLGRCESLEIGSKVDDLELSAPIASGGQYRLAETIPVEQSITLKALMQQWNQIFLEALFLASGAITVGTPFTPMRQSVKTRGWLQVKQYDHANQERFRHYFYVEITVDKMMSAKKEYKCEPTFKVIDNATGTSKVVALS